MYKSVSTEHVLKCPEKRINTFKMKGIRCLWCFWQSISEQKKKVKEWIIEFSIEMMQNIKNEITTRKKYRKNWEKTTNCHYTPFPSLEIHNSISSWKQSLSISLSLCFFVSFLLQNTLSSVFGFLFSIFMFSEPKIPCTLLNVIIGTQTFSHIYGK